AAPERVVLGAVLGGVAVGLLGPILAASGVADLGSLFPRPLAVRTWIAAEGGLREMSLGLRVDARGVLSLEGPAPPLAGALPAGSKVFTVITLALSSLACPAWIAASMEGSSARRAAVFATALSAAIVAFQAVAAGRAPPFVLVIGPLVLLIDAA